jgi:hypothetical protein
MKRNGKIVAIVILFLLIGINFVPVLPAGVSQDQSEGKTLKLVNHAEEVISEGVQEPLIEEEPTAPISYGPGDPEPTGGEVEVDAQGPYGTPSDPYYEGEDVNFQADIINGNISDYRFAWDIDDDFKWEKPLYNSVKGDANFTYHFNDDFTGPVRVVAWDEVSTENVSGNGTMFNNALPTSYVSKGGIYSVGVRFAVHKDITLYQVGIFNESYDDIYNIQIYDEHVVILSILMDPVVPENNWGWFDISPVDLNAGNDYFICARIKGQTIPFAENPGRDPLDIVTPVGSLVSSRGYPTIPSGESPLPLVDIRYDYNFQRHVTIQNYTDVNIFNVAPSVEAGADIITIVGDKAIFHGSFTDPGTEDTHQIQWNFGDGFIERRSLDTKHVYNNPGVYTVTLLVVDDDKGIGFDNLTVVVRDHHTIVEKIQNLIKMVESLGLPAGIENALVSKLKNAMDAYNMGNYKAAMNKILAFVAHIGALRDKKIQFRQANELIVSAHVIRDHLLEKLG